LFYQTHHRDKARLPHDPFKAIVAPGPIGWISTRALDGRINLAPYSFFNGFAHRRSSVSRARDGRMLRLSPKRAGSSSPI
jgi:flavin reductase (DIM6/NTAB) family NADH-FMN oxidoreductase RutF